MTEKPLSIERIAEKLGVNFYDLHPLLAAREDYLVEQATREILEEIVPRIKKALEAPTHEINDYNCEDWPIGEGCSGCKGDKLRAETIQWLASFKTKGEWRDGKVNIYIICPVRNLSEQWKDGLLSYAKMLESQGHVVHLPFRDTPQNDRTGLNICQHHAQAMRQADEVHIAYDGKSEGCLFDLGMAFILNKPICPITGYFPNISKGKSYSNMVWAWNAQCYDL